MKEEHFLPPLLFLINLTGIFLGLISYKSIGSKTINNKNIPMQFNNSNR